MPESWKKPISGKNLARTTANSISSILNSFKNNIKNFFNNVKDKVSTVIPSARKSSISSGFKGQKINMKTIIVPIILIGAAGMFLQGEAVLRIADSFINQIKAAKVRFFSRDGEDNDDWNDGFNFRSLFPWTRSSSSPASQEASATSTTPVTKVDLRSYDKVTSGGFWKSFKK
jgi:hypothetical protein